GTIVAGRGAGGNVIVAATELVSLSGPNSGLASNTVGSGNGGTIAISTPVLKVEDSAGIQARTIGDGKAGDVQITATHLSVTGGALMNSSSGVVDSTTGQLVAGKGHGGNITVTATESIALAGPTSGLFSRTAGDGNAGDVRIEGKHLLVTGGAQINSSSGFFDSTTGLL